MHVMPHARVVSRILQASGTACINALGRLGSALLTPLSLHFTPTTTAVPPRAVLSLSERPRR